MPSQNHVPVVLRIPPPLLFVATFLVGVLFERLLSVAPHARAWLLVDRWLGIPLVVAGAMLAAIPLYLFFRARTTLVPFGDPARLVDSGPYRLSRNPMYLSLASAHAGVALLANHPVALALLPIPLALVGRFVVPAEEARMRATFGAAYEAYCRRVRRWL